MSLPGHVTRGERRLPTPHLTIAVPLAPPPGPAPCRVVPLLGPVTRCAWTWRATPSICWGGTWTLPPARTSLRPAAPPSSLLVLHGWLGWSVHDRHLAPFRPLRATSTGTALTQTPGTCSPATPTAMEGLSWSTTTRWAGW